jgi:putative ABC transport system ATP-binding protein
VAVFDIVGVTVRRGSAVPLLDVSLTICGGRCTALVGPSGAGKSTLLRLLNRFEEPSEGEVRLHDRALPSYDVQDLRRRVGLVSQTPVLLTGDVLEDVRVGRPDLTKQEAAELLQRVGLPAGFVDRPTLGLSGGEAQRVCFARALAVRPEALLLDEPTSALDAESAETVEQVIEDLLGEGMTIVLVTHKPDQARRLGDDLITLAGGRVTGAAAVRAPSARVPFVRAPEGA